MVAKWEMTGLAFLLLPSVVVCVQQNIQTWSLARQVISSKKKKP